jgi:putative FmdB family regulatory protein
MPIYEYECSHCRYYLEVMQKLSDARLKKCPSCGKNALKKLISAPVFRLKGSGWYETDFKSDQDNKRNLAGAEREETAGHAKDGRGRHRGSGCQGGRRWRQRLRNRHRYQGRRGERGQERQRQRHGIGQGRVCAGQSRCRAC